MNYYNEIDAYAAEWLRCLIDDDLIPFGVVDTRDIKDVHPHELTRYTQCHFFAGIGGWPLALRMAGWDDDKPVWTGSCPCQPFSAAGRRLGFADERDLWPHWHWLIAKQRPSVVFGEQVAGAPGLGWLDRVFSDLEGSGYACGAAPLPACSVGAPHKRERIFFVADASSDRQLWRSERNSKALQPEQQAPQRRHVDGCDVEDDGVVAGANLTRDGEEREQRGGQLGGAGGDQEACAVEHAACDGRREGRAEPSLRGGWPAAAGAGVLGNTEHAGERGRYELQGPSESGSADCERASGELGGSGNSAVGDANDARSQGWIGLRDGSGEWSSRPPGMAFWNDAEWIAGYDGKARRVKPGVRLLVDGVPSRVAKLRALGNAIVPQVAAEFIIASGLA